MINVHVFSMGVWGSCSTSRSSGKFRYRVSDVLLYDGVKRLHSSRQSKPIGNQPCIVHTNASRDTENVLYKQGLKLDAKRTYTKYLIARCIGFKPLLLLNSTFAFRKERI